MKNERTALIHYTGPPIVAGVEAVMLAQARAFIEAGFPITLFVGRGNPDDLPTGAGMVVIPEMDAQNPEIQKTSKELEQGRIPADFAPLVDRIAGDLGPQLQGYGHVIVHNVLSKHYNLPLTAAIFKLFHEGTIKHLIDWVHDLSWTSSHSSHQVHPGYPWDLLRTYDPRITYVAISLERQKELSGLIGCSADQIHIVYSGVDPDAELGLSPEIHRLANRFGLLGDSINFIMPVRIAQIKNIEFAERIIAQLKTHGYPVQLVITGPLDVQNPNSRQYFQLLLELRASLGLQNQVHFIYEEEVNGEHLVLDSKQVGEFYRLSDALLMPSHSEGFGMPVLEAAIVGLPVFSTSIPAARETGKDLVNLFSPDDTPEVVASMLESWIDQSTILQFKRRVRSNFTWQAIFEQQIRPILELG